MENFYDVIIVGGGPAGLTAALYLARAKYRCLVLEKEAFGGQIAITHQVVNYPGIAETEGKALTETIRQQGLRFGAEYRLGEVTGFTQEGDLKTVHSTAGDFRCLGILLSTGAHPRTVGFQGEETYKGRGVAYCATCDGEFFTGKEIFVVGGGYAAAEESVFLTNFARHVTVLVRRDDFSCAASVSDPVKTHPNITVLYHTVLEEVSGENGLTYARYRNTATGEVTEYQSKESFGVFVFAGYAPATQFLQGTVDLDEQGYILTDATQKTSVDGVYAAGDVCVKPLRQVVTATGDGALAATELEKYVAALRQKTGLRAPQPTKAPEALFSADIKAQLDTVFTKMAQPLLLKLHLDARPVSAELKAFIADLCEMTPKLTMEISHAPKPDAPCVEICLSDGTSTGLAFHGVPGGHEFTSFILGLYNAAGPGQPLDEATAQQIAAIDRPVDLKILVTLSCTLCPELVTAAQQLAAQNRHITAHVYDLRHFEDLKRQHQILSVPCLLINNQNPTFGKKSLPQLLTLLQSQIHP